MSLVQNMASSDACCRPQSTTTGCSGNLAVKDETQPEQLPMDKLLISTKEAEAKKLASPKPRKMLLARNKNLSVNVDAKAAAGFGGIQKNRTPVSPGTRLRNAILSPLTPSHRHRNFQAFRENLWKHGPSAFCESEHADAFIVPVEMPSTKKDMPLSKGIDVQVVVKSANRPPVRLSRTFDLDMVRSTIPEPLPSPRTPGFDADVFLTRYVAQARLPSPLSPSMRKPESGETSPNVSEASTKSKSPRPDDLRSPVPRGMPIHLTYARAQVPVLASILMSDFVRHGDTVEIPVPWPNFWMETMAFVYTGEELLATEEVRQNISYLGGQVS